MDIDKDLMTLEGMCRSKRIVIMSIINDHMTPSDISINTEYVGKKIDFCGLTNVYKKLINQKLLTVQGDEVNGKIYFLSKKGKELREILLLARWASVVVMTKTNMIAQEISSQIRFYKRVISKNMFKRIFKDLLGSGLIDLIDQKRGSIVFSLTPRGEKYQSALKESMLFKQLVEVANSVQV